ncbi:MAG: hypothetical protein QW057_01610 [Candidatus Bathyarchaeia archaeon]
MGTEFYAALEDRLSRRLRDPAHRELLRQVLQWYREGGSKQVTSETKERVTLILGGLSPDAG